jgi:hypothetical protein
MNIIIPSAKIVPEELQSLGKLPAVIYPVNQKIVFEYLQDCYKNASFTVVCYENADKVHRRLTKYKNTKIIDLDQLGDLGYTVWYGIKDLTGAGVINFADTIVENQTENNSGDVFYYADDEISDTWTFFKEQNGVITEIVDKKKQNESKDRQGKLFVGVFHFSHLEYLAECLNKALQIPNPGMSSFYYALQLYSQKYALTPIKTDKWFDIGHADKYYNAQLEVKAREFNHIKIDKQRGILTKSSDDVDKFIGEIKWYLKLPADIEYVRPRIFDYSISYNKPHVSMEYYAYHTVHEMFLYGDLNRSQWINIFKRILFVCRDLQRYTVRDDDIKQALEDMYLHKTIQRFDRLQRDERFAEFFSKAITVNGVKYKPLNGVIKVLRETIPAMLYDVDQFHIIHGDMCFANIMVDNNFNFIKLIDPRGKFGKYDIYGDQRYELAKLFHSVDGKYDFIIKDLFNLDYNLDRAVINYRINDRVRDYDLYELFLEVFNDEIGDDLKKVELIEALLFLSMIPLHGESLKHQLTMLGTGLDILNRVVNITA